MKTRLLAVLAVFLVSAFGLAACSTQARAERKGKAAGDEICKAKNANSANAAQRHITTANRKLDSLSRYTGRSIRQDIRVLNRNLNQMARGNGTDQEVSAIVSSIESARRTASGNAAAAYDGILEALASCD